ncbi:hypothetical protein ABIC74_004919 [Mucilaginibacter rubeus]
MGTVLPGVIEEMIIAANANVDDYKNARTIHAINKE